MSIFMQIKGVKGNVTTKGYEGWIQLRSFDNGVKRNITSQVGRVTDREGAKPSFQEIEVTKNIDLSTPALYQDACEGTSIPVVEIHVCSTGAELSPYAKYKLNNVVISRYNEVVLGEEHPFEIIGLNFTKIEKTYISRDSQNKPQSPVTFGYDLETAKKL